MKIKDLASVTKKYTEVTPQRAPQYEAGVRNPVRDWAIGASGANDAWKAGIQEAVSKDKFKAGVAKAGTAAWQKGAVEKGVARFGPGVLVAGPDYQAGFAPYHAAIERIVLPPRYARRDPRNLARVATVATALGAVKVATVK